MLEYQAIHQQRLKFNEANDCTVVALALAAQVPYEVAHKELARLGRRPRRGVLNCTFMRALKNFGYRNVNYYHPLVKTTRHVPMYLPKEHVFLVHVTQHVYCYKGGVVPAAERKRKRIQWIQAVYAEGQEPPPPPQFDPQPLIQKNNQTPFGHRLGTQAGDIDMNILQHGIGVKIDVFDVAWHTRVSIARVKSHILELMVCGWVSMINTHTFLRKV